MRSHEHCNHIFEDNGQIVTGRAGNYQVVSTWYKPCMIKQSCSIGQCLYMVLTFECISSMRSAQRLRMLRRRTRESMSACSRKAWSFSTLNFDKFIGNWRSKKISKRLINFDKIIYQAIQETKYYVYRHKGYTLDGYTKTVFQGMLFECFGECGRIHHLLGTPWKPEKTDKAQGTKEGRM